MMLLAWAVMLRGVVCSRRCRRVSILVRGLGNSVDLGFWRTGGDGTILYRRVVERTVEVFKFARECEGYLGFDIFL